MIQSHLDYLSMNTTTYIKSESQDFDILVIDDEVRMADSIKRLLSNWGYRVDVAYTGADGIEKVKKFEYPLVFTDLRMADVDGFDVMRFIHDNYPNTLLIIITGHASTESAIEAVHYHAFDYITKPFDIEHLRQAVTRAFDFIEAKRQREEMLYMLTHDIKVPLSSILGYSSMIYDKEKGTLRPDVKDLADNISLLSEKTVALIDNFLSMTKIARGALKPLVREVDVKFLLEDLCQILCLEAQKKNITWQMECPDNLPPIQADESLIYRAVGNLIINAVKYTDRGGRIHIKADCLPAGQSPLGRDTVRIEFGNSGPGIDAADLQRLFEKYHRAKNVAGIQGSGLGLFVVKNVVEAHRGRVEAESRPEDWTTFRVFLPCNPELEE